jgi:hypothetical protein
MKWFQAFRSSLDAVDPRLFWLLIFAIVLLLIAGIRWKWPSLWDRLPGRAQAIPAMLVAAVPSALSSAGDLKKALVDTLLGALVGGLGAIGAYHVAKGPAKPVPSSVAGEKLPADRSDSVTSTDA